MAKQLPAPGSVIHLVRCTSCNSKCNKGRCGCRIAKLSCTDMCDCSTEGECENTSHFHTTQDSQEDSDSDNISDSETEDDSFHF